MEAHGRKRAGWRREAAAADAPRPRRRRRRPANIPEQLAAARRAPRQGRDQRGRVRGEEGAAARAHVSAARRGSSRSCRRRPRRCDALGVEPVGVTRFCDATGPAVVGGTKNPDLDAIVALAPGSRRRQRRGEPRRGRRRRSRPPGSRCTRCRPARSRTSAPRCVRLPRGSESRVPSPFGARRVGRLARVDAHARAGGTRSSRCGAGRGCRSPPTPTARRCSTCSASATCSPTRSTAIRR